MTEARLAEESFLTDAFLGQLISVGELDILVGVPTHNDAKTIGSIVETIQAGILTFFPRERAAIINVDGGSRDGTPELVVNAAIGDAQRSSKLYALRTLPSISTQYATSPASGTALRTILAAAELLRAKACAVISPESTQITADWLAALLRPVYAETFDLVLPTYRRHRFDGILLTNLLYPMTRALYGLRNPRALRLGVRILWPPREPISCPEPMARRNRSGWFGNSIHPGCDCRRVPYLPVLPGNQGACRKAFRRFGSSHATNRRGLVLFLGTELFVVEHQNRTPSRSLRPARSRSSLWSHCD